MFAGTGFRFFNNDFPYLIFYEVDEHEVLVVLVMKATTTARQ
jgi:hypothetical protein